MSADTFRLIAISLTLLACLTMPWAIYRRVKSEAVVLVVLVLVLQYVGAALAAADSLGEPIVWYRTPRIFAAAVISLVYVCWAFSRPPTRRR